MKLEIDVQDGYTHSLKIHNHPMYTWSEEQIEINIRTKRIEICWLAPRLYRDRLVDQSSRFVVT